MWAIIVTPGASMGEVRQGAFTPEPRSARHVGAREAVGFSRAGRVPETVNTRAMVLSGPAKTTRLAASSGSAGPDVFWAQVWPSRVFNDRTGCSTSPCQGSYPFHSLIRVINLSQLATSVHYMEAPTRFLAFLASLSQ